MKYNPSWKRTDVNKLYEETGTFIGVKWAESTADILVQWAKDNNIPNIISKDEIHSTVIYSRVGFKHELSDKDFSFSTRTGKIENRFHVFENKKLNHKALVIKIISPDLEERHKEIMKNNPRATYDFPEYIPHITLSYDIEDFDVSTLSYEDFTERLSDASGGREYHEDLDINKYKK